jgi:predicted nucleic acid-binding protein
MESQPIVEYLSGRYGSRARHHRCPRLHRRTADHAEAIIGRGGAISVQVLNELANVARRKMRMSWQDTTAFLSLLGGLLTVHSVAVETHETGLALAERYDLSIYDMIAASALHAIATRFGRRICSTRWCSTAGCASSTRFVRRGSSDLANSLPLDCARRL